MRRRRPDRLLGRSLAGRYLALRLLAEGASSRVYLARQTCLGRHVALKVLKAELRRDRACLERFEREAAIASRLSHPNLVAVHDSGRDRAGGPFIAMEYAGDRTLDELIRGDSPVPVPQALELGLQVLAGLEEAHAQGVVHADVKSSNVAVEERRGGRFWARVFDFGIARLAGDEVAEPSPHGAILGTPIYVAPEIIRGDPPTAASDVYAAGVLLYELLTGTAPFAGATLVALLDKHLRERPEAPSDRLPGAGIPLAIEQVVLRALSKEPQDRFIDAGCLREALERGALARRRRHRHRAGVESPANRSPAGEPATVHVGGADPTRPVPALEPIREVVASLLGLSPAPGPVALAVVSRRMDLEEADLAGMLELFGHDGPLAEVDGYLRRRALAGTVESLVVAVARRRPVVLAFEDEQAHDPLSRELAGRLEARLADHAGVEVIRGGPLSLSPGAAPPLSPLAIRLLRAAAVCGGRARRDAVVAVAGCDPADADRELAPLEDAGLVRGDAIWIRFGHAAMPELVRASIDHEARRSLHAAFCEHLAPRSPRAAELAYHLEHAGCLDAAAERWGAAAGEARRYLDPEGAAALYRRAGTLARRALAGSLREERVSRVVALDLGRAFSLIDAGRREAAEQALVAPGDWIELLADPRLTAWHLCVGAELAARAGDGERALARLEDAALAAIAAGVPDLALETSTRLAQELAAAGAAGSALATLERAEQALESAPPRGAWQIPLLAAELHLASEEGLAHARACAARGLELARACGSGFGSCRAHAILAAIEKRLGATREAARHELDAREGMARLARFA